MVIKNVSLETVCGITSKIPDNPYSEVAFSGKSNVGKSSLINALMNRKSLARTSSQPGKTQTINFYNVNDALYFVDLPGYGYARLGGKARAELQEVIWDYIRHSEELVMLFVLLDSRHDMQKIDLAFMAQLGEEGIPFGLIFTKGDKQGPNVLAAQVEKNCSRILEEWEELPPCFVSSARTGAGKEEILRYIGEVLETL